MALEFFKAHIKSFSDAFPTIIIREEEWGLIFEWPNSTHITTNFALIKNDQIENKEYMLKWLKEDKSRKLFIPTGEVTFDGTEADQEIGIYYRNPKKIQQPILDSETVNSHSYRTISNDFNLKDVMNVLAEMVEISEEKILEFHRLIGGHMHLNEGKIWTLDNDGAVLSAALTVENTEFKNIKLIELLSTRSKVRMSGHASNLMQSIFAHNKKIGFVVVAIKTLAHQKILDKFGFELIRSYDLHTIK